MIEEMKAMIADQMQIDPASIQNDTLIMEDLGADSLDIVELLMNLEDRYQITIPDEDVLKLKTVQDVADYIQAHTQA